MACAIKYRLLIKSSFLPGRLLCKMTSQLNCCRSFVPDRIRMCGSAERLRPTFAQAECWLLHVHHGSRAPVVCAKVSLQHTGQGALMRTVKAGCLTQHTTRQAWCHRVGVDHRMVPPVFLCDTVLLCAGRSGVPLTAPVNLRATLVLLAVGMLQSAVQEQAACTQCMQFTLVMSTCLCKLKAACK